MQDLTHTLRSLSPFLYSMHVADSYSSLSETAVFFAVCLFSLHFIFSTDRLMAVNALDPESSFVTAEDSIWNYGLRPLDQPRLIRELHIRARHWPGY